MSSDGGAGMSTDELRATVRAVLRDVLPSGTTARAASDGATVTIRDDAELAAFVRRVAVLCEDASSRADLQAGRHRFRLVAPGGGLDRLDHRNDHPVGGLDRLDHRNDHPVGGLDKLDHGDSAIRVERGAVTERAVKAAATDGKRLIVGRRAVLTPLARDKARSLGVVIEKED
jgi:hypothetical protein